jgi:hypothetical protein
MRKMIKKIILLLPFLFFSCASLHINKEKVQNIEVIYEPTTALRDTPLLISIRSEGIKNILIEDLNKSKKSFVAFGLKEALIEGRYIIHVKYDDKETIDVFDVSNSEDLFWENNDSFYKNKRLLGFLRSILFYELIERNIKLNDITK